MTGLLGLILSRRRGIGKTGLCGLPRTKAGDGGALRAGTSSSPDELFDWWLFDWCKGRIAGYKRPRSVSIIHEDEMPRTATGKILHRQLRARYANATH